MASVIGASDVAARPSAAGLIKPERSEQFEEALRALENYKKKDPSKGATLNCISVTTKYTDLTGVQSLSGSKPLEMPPL
jgi:hypothetical protein